MTDPRPADWRLEDRYGAISGRGLLTGLQAVARSPLDQRRRDERRGLATAAYVSGYPGSPLAGLDLELGRQRRLLEENLVLHRPGLNEELAATAVQGTQLIEAAGARYEGVAGFWYGKAPGLDRALDAIRHGNVMGTHPRGGVVAFVGDDGGAKSSSLPSASERTLRSAFVPVLAPADVQDVLDLSAHAVALSRAAGTWAAVKLATDVLDGSASVDLDLDRLEPVQVDPEAFPIRRRPPGGDLSPPVTRGLERTLLEERLPLAAEYGRVNGLNRLVRSAAGDRLGIVASGRTYPQLRQALASMEIGERELERLGLRLLRVGMPWPLAPATVREFAAGLERILVIEDKGPFVETLIAEALYGTPGAPALIAAGEGGEPLPRSGEVDAEAIVAAIGPWVAERLDHEPARRRLRARQGSPAGGVELPVAASRAPYFCSGCPHSTSTRVPEGTLVGGGIGCHGMIAMMDPERVGDLLGMTQMGGEGAQWLGIAPFVETEHVVQNIGDGTFAHSGSLAVRAAVADGANITYKLLYNSAVAMTGGQAPLGAPDVASLTRQLEAEGVNAIIVTTEDRSRYRGVELASIAKLWPRQRILEAQEELAAVAGVTVLIHDQECAAEKRRKRKRRGAPAGERRVLIDERVCEGCGDCGEQSNCLSVIPVETEFGTKTEIHQTSCNTDYSCLRGDCPSFATVTLPAGEGARPAPARALPQPLAAAQLPPPPAASGEELAVRLCGIGGTGVVTAAQVVATAAFLDSYQVRGLDQTGLAQKAGPVVSDLRMARGEVPGSNRLGTGECTLYLGCDVIVSSEARNLAAASPDRTLAVVSTSQVPTGEMVSHPDVGFPPLDPMLAAIASRSRGAPLALDAEQIAERALGSAQFANMVLVGAAFQAGGLPLGEAALERAIELNGVAVEANRQALLRGRQAIADPAGLAAAVAPPAPQPPAATAAEEELVGLVGARAGGELERLLRIRVPELVAYQSRRYARRYAEAVARVRAAEQRAVPGSEELAAAVAWSLYKLLAYKDEYEVARLLTAPAARERVVAQFGPDARVRLHLHPPLLRALGMERKIELGAGAAAALRLLPPLRRLRGTPLDPFGRARVRRVERQLPDEYLAAVERLLAGLRPRNHAQAVEIARLPDAVRGYEEIKLAAVRRYRKRLETSLSRYERAVDGGADNEPREGVMHA